MSELEVVKGVVFNIQHYSIHDGPGIRTTVFLKGCPLRCLWCQNPESQTSKPELFFASEKCTGCATCLPACTAGAIQVHDGRSWTNRDLCTGAGNCAQVCPNEARTLMGSEMTAGEVFKDVNGDSIFYQRSGGGVTLSGGDALAQPRFATALLQLCKQAGLHTTLDTCGYGHWETFLPILEQIDLVLFDLKHMDPVRHEQLTGVSNDRILENAKRIYHELHLPLSARVPIIPGLNDSTDNLAATARFIAHELDPSIRVHLLPYHKLGETKYERLEKTEQSFSTEPPSDEYMAELQKLVESFGLTVAVGG